MSSSRSSNVSVNSCWRETRCLIDGEAIEPILDRMNYVTVGVTGIQLVEQPERLEISTAIVGVILTYITDGIPQEVTVDWELFTRPGTDAYRRRQLDPAGSPADLS